MPSQTTPANQHAGRALRHQHEDLGGEQRALEALEDDLAQGDWRGDVTYMHPGTLTVFCLPRYHASASGGVSVSPWPRSVLAVLEGVNGQLLCCLVRIASPCLQSRLSPSLPPPITTSSISLFLCCTLPCPSPSLLPFLPSRIPITRRSSRFPCRSPDQGATVCSG